MVMMGCSVMVLRGFYEILGCLMEVLGNFVTVMAVLDQTWPNNISSFHEVAQENLFLHDHPLERSRTRQSDSLSHMTPPVEEASNRF